MSGPLVCPNCGARSPEAHARFCAFCGFELPAPAAPAAPLPPLDLPARFHALRRHPGFEALQGHVPAGGGRQAGALAHVLSAAALVAVGLLLLFPALAFPPVAVAVVVVVALGVLLLASAAAKAFTQGRGKLVRVPALVADERTDLAGGGDGGMSTRYYLALESERGTREEYEIDGRLAGKVAPGDLGVAFFKGPRLIDFERVPV
jgi:hypothetical protein